MQQLDFLKALADETRLHLVLLVAQHQELCVCDFVTQLNLSQPKISRHLALLRSAGILSDRRAGQWVYYRLDADLPEWAFNTIEILKQSQPAAELTLARSNCGE